MVMILLTENMIKPSDEGFGWYEINPTLRSHCKTYNGFITCLGVIKEVERKLIEADLGETLELLQGQSICFIDKRVDEFLASWTMLKTFSYGFSFYDINDEILFKLALE